MIDLINKSGVDTVKGELIEISTTVDEAFVIGSTNTRRAQGVVYEAGVPTDHGAK